MIVNLQRLQQKVLPLVETFKTIFICSYVVCSGERAGGLHYRASVVIRDSYARSLTPSTNIRALRV